MELDIAIGLVKYNSISQSKGVWADLGCGSGLFSYALANHLQRGSVIYAIDRKKQPLNRLSNPNDVTIISQQKDFESEQLGLTNLSGIMMANSLHFVRDKKSFIGTVSKSLNANGLFLIVEYDTHQSNPWVPFPETYPRLSQTFAESGFHSSLRLGDVQSVYGPNKIYAAVFYR